MLRVLMPSQSSSKQSTKPPSNLADCCLYLPMPEALSWLRQDKYWRYVQLGLDLLLEVVLVVIFLKVYNLVRNQFGSQRCSPEFALGHALQVIRVEQALGFYWEEAIQRPALAYPLWVRFWNIFYGTAHMAVTIFVLGFLFALKPAAYQRCRTVFMLMNLLALLGYAGYPLMPPRLVPDCNDPYGGCRKEFHYMDTLEEIGGLWSWKHAKISKVSNHYAAMPSMHAGYSIWCSTSMYGHSPFTLFKVLALVYPWLTLYCIVVTANHFLLDAVFGVLALLLAYKLSPYMPQFGRGVDSSGSGGGGAGGEMEEGTALLPVTSAAGGEAGAGGGKRAVVEAAESAHTINISIGNLKNR